MIVVFYDIFESLCRQKGVSPNKACIEMGLSRSISAKWKSTKTNPSADVLPKIADYFEVPVDYLLGHYPIIDMYEVVSYLCRKNGISIRQMCNATGVSESTISNLKHKRLARLSIADQVAIANYFQVSTDVFCEGVLEDALPNQADAESIAGFHYLQKEEPSLELGEPIGAITGIPIIASVKAGYDGLAVEDDTGEYVQIPSVMLRGHPGGECRAMHIRGDSMYPKMQDGDIVVVHIQQEVENGKVAVCIVNGDEGTIKRFFKFSDRVELWPDNPQIPKMVLKGQCLESFHIYGQAIALIREDL